MVLTWRLEAMKISENIVIPTTIIYHAIVHPCPRAPGPLGLCESDLSPPGGFHKETRIRFQSCETCVSALRLLIGGWASKNLEKPLLTLGQTLKVTQSESSGGVA